jgi:tetratricopeptide (TPR) repeat protein
MLKKGSNRSTSNSNTILRKIYFDLEKNNDAIETFSKVSLFESISPTATYAETYYLGLTEMQKLNYKEAKIYFNKAKAIYKLLKLKKRQI